MYQAPQPQLTATRACISAGMRGVRQTLDAMRRLVREGRSNLKIRQAATTAVFLTPERDELSEVQALFSLVRDGIRYVRDIHDVETLSTADKTLEGRIGDCDDQTVLLAALCEAIGYPTRFVVAGYTTPGEVEHVYMQVFAGGIWIDADPTEHQPLGWSAPDPVALFIEKV